MPYHLPKLQFIRSRYITLNEGFHRTGMFMFPEEWTGLEDMAWPAINPNSLCGEKQRLEKNFLMHSRHERDVRLTDITEMNEVEYQAFRQLSEKVGEQKQDAREQRDQFGQTFDARYSDALAYARRQHVEKKLCQLIRKQTLDVRIGHGTGVNMDQWFQKDQFHISFTFSYIIAPEHLGRRRRFPAYFNKDVFNTWALPLETDLQQYNSEPVEEQMLVWFRMYRGKHLALGERPKVASAQAECEDFFGSDNLPKHFKNKFKSVWNLLAPEAWSKGGAPKKP